MIVYGSKMYFKSNVVKAFGTCEHCGRYGKNTSYQARKFGHLYFIPLIPMGAKSQVIRECKTCNMGAHVPLDQLDKSVDALADQFKSWIMAIGEGETELVVAEGEKPVNLGILVAGILEDLYSLKEIENVESLQSILDANNMVFEKEIVNGQWWEIQGDLNRARLSYQAALNQRPDDLIALYQLGMAEIKSGNSREAESVFSAYLKGCPEDTYAVYVELASLHEQKKDYPKIVESYDVLYDSNPEVIPHKAMKKVYKKACKKSGLQGKFLNQM